MNGSSYSPGFATLDREVAVSELAVAGEVPGWLEGSLLRTGPARFEVEKERYNHWFDGLAMLHRFGFQDGRVSYTNRYVRGKSYQEAMAAQAIRRGEFASSPRPKLWEYILPFRKRHMGDNGNVNTDRIGDHFLALTETPTPLQFNPDTLKTEGAFRFDDDLSGQLTTAHPLYDAERECQYNYLIEFGRQSKYHLFRCNSRGRRQRVATIPVSRPAYMHSFGMTRNYLILTEFPLVVNPLSLLVNRRPFIQNYRWQPERGTTFRVIEKDSGREISRAQTDAFFAFHHVNAFEEGDAVVADIISYPDASIVDDLYLDRLRSEQAATGTGRLTRFRLKLGGDDNLRAETLTETPLEFPRFDHENRAGDSYRYVYCAGSVPDREFVNCLVKIDLEDGGETRWQEASCYPGEAVFVPAPKPTAEDSGVLMSVVLDSARERSFLLVLDASSFTELARADLPHVVPFGFHGNFYGDKAAGPA